MTFPDPDDRGPQFPSFLGDLMNMLGSNAPDQWGMTRSFALNVATGGSAEANVDPVGRIRLEELARAAELHVIEATGMPSSSDGRRITCVPVGPGDWTLRALDAWRPVLSAMSPPPAAPPTIPAFGSQDDPMADLGGLLGQWTAAIGPMFFGLQLGSVVGHLSHRALGQYVLAVPWPVSDELLIVTANVDTFASDWSLPPEEALLWTCARELATHAVLSRPAIRARIDAMLLEVAEASATAQRSLADRLGDLGDPSTGGAMDLEAMQSLFSDPEAMLGDFLTPESQRSSEQLTAVAIVVDAYADHIADRAGTSLVGSHSQLSEAWYRRRIERGKGEEAAGALFGLDLEQAQVDRGRSFITGVVERSDESALARLWSSGRNLPTPAEVDAPGLWLERISLPELGEPSGGE